MSTTPAEIYSEDRERMVDFSPQAYLGACYARTGDTEEGKARFVKVGFVNNMDAAERFLDGDLTAAIPYQIWYIDENGDRHRLE